jgi:branched-chain amino acid transport system ATP-binding protein
VIRVEHVRLAFGGLVAVDDCSFTVARGSITGIVGPNGAGKTTIFNVIAGELRPSAGSVFLDGEEVTGLPPHALYKKGLLRTFQIAHEFRRMTVLENLMVAADRQTGESLVQGLLAPGRVWADEARIRARAFEVLAFLDLADHAERPAGLLSGGQKKLLELGRTLMREAKVILLDEIAAGVNRTLLRSLVDRIRRLNREDGLTFCLIEQDMELVAELCDPVIVMVGGRVLTAGSMAAVQSDPAVIDAYLGR